MGYWYWRQLKNGWAVDENTTNKFDLPETGYVSGLAIQLYNTNETTLSSYPRPYPIQRVTKLRIVGNGNFEIVNCEARHLQAMNFWDFDSPVEGQYSQIDTHFQRNFWYVPFGRYLRDPKYGLILEKFAAGVEFEETNDVSTTYYTDGATKYNIFALMRKNPEAGLFSGGYLKKRQIINKDTASESQYAVKLPTQAKLKQIHIFSEPDLSSYVDATSPTTNVQYIWLGVKSREEYILNNVRSIDWANHIHLLRGKLAETHVMANTAESGGLSYVDTMIYRRFNTVVCGINVSSADRTAIADFNSDRRICKVWGFSGGTAAAIDVQAYNTGIMLHGDIPLLDIDPLSDETEWFDAKANADVYVEVTEGASTGNWYIVLDELEKSYGD